VAGSEARDEAAERGVPFGALLRDLREGAGLTQEELARRAGLSPNAVGTLERGARKHPYPHTVRSLADALGLSQDERATLLAAVPRRDATAPDISDPGLHQSSLPSPPTPLVGRERELAEIGELLLDVSEVRLLTLTGIGGVGKTRLALAVARAALAENHFPDGSSFVALASLRDPTLVVSTIARSLGLREAEGQSTGDTLRAYLREKRMLLVLDNLEQVLEAAAEVAGLIEACPGLTVLATSRAPLRVRGEQEYPVPPLALPSSTHNASKEDVLEIPSGRLFVERARAASPSFALTTENAPSVAAICWRLAGLPLALELAAAKARFMEPAMLLRRLDRALSTGWTRDLPERQRTMKATLDWSHDLLREPEGRLFQRLSVFHAGFTLGAAEAVGAADDSGTEDVLDLLGELVDQSLVTVQRSTVGGEVRYGMLEPVRQYAHEKLEESGEATTIGRSHASFFLALAERAYPELMGARQVEWLDQLDQEHRNLMAAVSWALDTGDAETGARLGWALWLFWMIRGYQREGRRWMEALLALDLSPALRAKVLVSVASLAYGHGDYEWCERYSEESLQLSRQLGDTLRVAWAEFGLGVTAMSRADHEAATPHLQESLRSFREIGDDFGVARATICLGMVALMRGDVNLATGTFEESLAVARRIEDRTGACITLYNLAQLALSRGDHGHATTLFEEGITLSEQVTDRANVAYCLEGLAVVAGAQGNAERSARLFGAAEGLLEVLGAPVYTYYKPDPSLYERTVSATRSRLGDVAFEEAREQGRKMGFEQVVEYALAHDEEKASPA
jgi:predicted ATPase/DNA-binding XRE family transcriptional regulator